jgi:large subunit ribosomal protein L27
MAHKKAGGSSKNGRDSNPKYLGVKCYGSQLVAPGNIIIRQRGTKYHPGLNVGIGRDHTLYAKVTGILEFIRKGKENRQYVNVIPADRQVSV